MGFLKQIRTESIYYFTEDIKSLIEVMITHCYEVWNLKIEKKRLQEGINALFMKKMGVHFLASFNWYSTGQPESSTSTSVGVRSNEIRLNWTLSVTSNTVQLI